MVDWDGDNMRLDNDWIRYFDWVVDWVWDFNFLNNWDFNLFVNWILFYVVMMDRVYVIGDRNLDVFAAKKK
jgi:hypothetical protein